MEKLAGKVGVEPTLAESESAVLPLDDFPSEIDGVEASEGFEPSCDRLEEGCLKSARLRTREFVVPTSGIEPLASSLPWMRSPY